MKSIAYILGLICIGGLGYFAYSQFNSTELQICSAQVNYYGYGDGNNKWELHSQDEKGLNGTMKIFERTYPSSHKKAGQVLSQQGISLVNPVCLYDALKEVSITEEGWQNFMISDLESKSCYAKYKESFQENKSVIIKAKEINRGGNANYTTKNYITLENFKFNSEDKWMCN